jgi:hypothetical protein
MVELNTLVTTTFFNKIYQLIFATLSASNQTISLSHPNTSLPLLGSTLLEGVFGFFKNQFDHTFVLFSQVPILTNNLFANVRSFFSSLSHYIYFNHVVTLGGLKCSL